MGRQEGKGNESIYFKNGEILLFEKFFRENFSKFYAFADRFTDDLYVSEDIVQEAFISVWESKKNDYDSVLMLQAFMYKTIRNKCLNYFKHAKIRERYSNEYVNERESEEYLLHSVLNEEAQYILHTAVNKLTPQCQTVIKLHLEGKKNKEIAEIMKISEVTVKSHKTLSYRELRRILQGALTFLLIFFTKNHKKNQF